MKSRTAYGNEIRRASDLVSPIAQVSCDWFLLMYSGHEVYMLFCLFEVINFICEWRGSVVVTHSTANPGDGVRVPV